MTATLKRYYPQVLEWFDDKDTQVFCTFLEHYPLLEQIRKGTTNASTVNPVTNSTLADSLKSF